MDYLEQNPIEQGPFEPTWESLRTFECPAWFRDAKFGIWSHWGPQSVPMYGDWYARNMYAEGQPQYLHHWREYGHPSRNGWKDIVPLWKAERFDPDGLMRLYAEAGARYFIAQAVHHDNFDNWNSRHHPWNAVKLGPGKDIVSLWRAAARKRGLRFGVSEHLAASFTWYAFARACDKTGPYAGVPYDGADPRFVDFYHPRTDNEWYTENSAFHARWFLRMKDLLDQQQPDLLYSDGGLPFFMPKRLDDKGVVVQNGAYRPEAGLHLVAHLYNLSAKRHGGANQAVYTQKDARPEVLSVGVLDVERGQMNDLSARAWQTDTCVGGWFYDVRQVYKTPRHVIEMLVEIVSKNGCLLLNLPQRPDGALDEECLHILRCLAAWTRVNGEGLYGTRPWKVAGEGPTAAELRHGAFKEEAVSWTTADFRFTAKDRTVYAFQMKYPAQRQAFIRSLGLGSGVKVSAVGALGHPGSLVFRQVEDGLFVQWPAAPLCDCVPCLKVALA